MLYTEYESSTVGLVVSDKRELESVVDCTVSAYVYDFLNR